MSKDWKKLINPNRRGAQYFLQQTGVLQCKPEDYVRFRNLGRKRRGNVMSEWATWMEEFKSSDSPVLKSAADEEAKLGKQLQPNARQTFGKDLHLLLAGGKDEDGRSQQSKLEGKYSPCALYRPPAFTFLTRFQVVELWLKAQDPYLNMEQRNPRQTIIRSDSKLVLRDRHAVTKAKFSLRKRPVECKKQDQ